MLKIGDKVKLNTEQITNNIKKDLGRTINISPELTQKIFTIKNICSRLIYLNEDINFFIDEININCFYETELILILPKNKIINGKTYI